VHITKQAMIDDTGLCIGLRQAAHVMTAIYDEALD
jgi:hypothetical protein